MIHRNKPKVVVVGGGIAGLTAAHELVERGFEVHVYEHRFRCGGKAASTRVDLGAARAGPDDVLQGMPAEHGFHFFAGWYRHLPDTLRRIASDRHTSDVGQRTVLDHLVPVGSNLLASYTRDPVPVVLHVPRSADQAQKLLSFAVQIGKMGLSANDALLFFTKLMEFLSVPDEIRRQRYDSMPWTTFIGLDERSPAFQLLTAHTRCLIAANPREASAYTIATMAVRTLFESSLTLDRILDGPTSEVWIEPWVRQLTGQGVTFHLGHDLEQIRFDGREPVVASLQFSLVDDRYWSAAEAGDLISDYADWRRCRHQTDWPERYDDFKAMVRTLRAKARQQARSGSGASQDDELVAEADYFVFALPIEQMAYYINRSTMMTHYDPSLRDVVRLSSSLDWMAGIQFYLKAPINLERGHVVCADSEWSLTAIEQTRFWRSPFVPPGVQAILSVDVSDWNKKGRFNLKPAFRCDPGEIAAEAWAQLKASFNRTTRNPVLQDDMLLTGDAATSAHLDDNVAETFDPVKQAEYKRAQAVRFSADEVLSERLEPEDAPFAFGERILSNVEPILINRPRTLALRPSPASDHIVNIFFAGDYVDTTTNLACMEGANEAARRAVNALLDQAGSNHERCTLWDFSDQNVLSTLAAITNALRAGPAAQAALGAATSAASTLGGFASRLAKTLRLRGGG